MAFFKAIYKPTKFYWKKEPKIPEPLLHETKEIKPQAPELDLTPARRQRIKEFMNSIHYQEQDSNAYEQYEQQRVSQLLTSFSQVTTQQQDVTKQIEKPSLVVRVRELKPQHEQEQVQGNIVYNQSQSITKKDQQSTDQLAQNISVPKSQQTKLQKQEDVEENTKNQDSASQHTFVESQVSESKNRTAKAASYNRELPFPIPPTEPNKPVGMVLSSNNQILPNAVIEVMDAETGNIVRAVKTNSLGQFFITTPLKNGNYILKTEKNGFQFPNQQLNLEGEIIPPIEIRGEII